MTTGQRVQAVVEFGFTERQARFLALVMRHAGVCVPRQYATFGGIANGGRRCNTFFDKLVRRGYANENGRMHNRARLYQVHHKLLYHVIGEATSRYRRAVSPRLAVERLMLLDAVLTLPDLEWLTTVAEKADFLARLSTATSVEAPQSPPADTPSATAPALSSAFPIGLQSDGRAILLYLATEPWTYGFRSFVQGHAALLRVAPRWTLRLVCPRPLNRVHDAYQTVIREELESPLHPATIRELTSYFAQRKQAGEGPVHPLTQGFLKVGAKVFGTPRFTEMYRRWLKHGNVVFEGPSSPVIAEALSDGHGRVESILLPHSYRHLFPLVTEAPAPPPPQPVEKGSRRGKPALTISEVLDRDWHRLNESYKTQKELDVAVSSSESATDW